MVVRLREFPNEEESVADVLVGGTQILVYLGMDYLSYLVHIHHYFCL